MTAKEALAALKASFRVADLERETVLIYVKKLTEIAPNLLEHTVNAAIDRCKFFPSIAELLEIATDLSGESSGHLGPEEAWALVANLGEDDTVVWTDEIAEAWGAARGALPDRVAARMAFLEVYRRQLAEARRVGAPAVWWPSLGWTAEGRAGPVLEAVAMGRLPQQAALDALPPAAWPTEWRGLLSAPEPAALPPPTAGTT